MAGCGKSELLAGYGWDDLLAGCGWGESLGSCEWLQFLAGCGWIGDGASPISGMKVDYSHLLAPEWGWSGQKMSFSSSASWGRGDTLSETISLD